MPARETREYTLQNPCRLDLEFTDEYIGFWGVTSEDPAEDVLLGEDGPYCAWDAVVTFGPECLYVDGSDGPSGGTHVHIRLVIPQRLLRGIRTCP